LQVRAATDETEVPFAFEKGHIIVAAKINGKTSVEVELSTGTEHSLINELVLEKYKLKSSYTGDGIITGSSLDKIIIFVAVSDLQVGDVKAPTMYMRYGAQATTQIGQRIGREVFAVLGADFFKGRVVQFDFRKRVVRFMNHAPNQVTPGANFTTLKMRPGSEPIQLPITEEVTVAGKKLKTLFDTGALTVISLTPSGSKQVGLAAPPDKGPPRTDKLSSLRFGEIEFTDIPVTLHAKDSDFDRDSKGYAAVVGVAVLQNFIVTFDFAGGVINLERI
jgi:hypothetical protein